MIKPWPMLGSRALGNYRIFSVRSDEKVSPRTGQKHDFFIIESVDWVNVLAITASRELVMIEQYRHGSNTVELEIPGGAMDRLDTSPLLAGVRELREETGFEGENARLLADVFSNPAIMSNRTHTVLVENCELRHPTEMDSGEDLMTRLVAIADVPALVAAGKIKHPLVVVALYHLELWQRGLNPV